MMNNVAMKELVKEYGTRINSISLNNGKVLFLDYSDMNTPSVNELEFVTISGCDFIKVPHLDISHNPENPTKYFTLLVTEFIENIEILDASNPDHRIDPFVIK